MQKRTPSVAVETTLPEDVVLRVMPHEFQKMKRSRASFSPQTLVIGGLVIFMVLSITAVSWYFLRGRGVPAPASSLAEAPTSIQKATSTPSPTKSTSTTPDEAKNSSEITQESDTASPSFGSSLYQPVVSEFAKVSIDSDTDGLTNQEERMIGTDAQLPDTDGDGYIDGQELINLYNPLGVTPITLLQSGIVKEFINTSQGYTLMYPSSWVAGSVDATQKEVVISSDTGEYISIVRIEVPQDTFLTGWYRQQFPATEIIPTQLFTTKQKLSAVRTRDGYGVYVQGGGNLFAILYNGGTRPDLNFVHIVTMIAHSLQVGGNTVSTPPIQPTPVSPVVPSSSSVSSTTSTAF